MRLKKRRILKIKRRGRGYCMIIMIGYEMKYYKKKRRGYWRIIIIGYEIKYVWRYHKKVGRKGYNYNHLTWDLSYKIRWDMEISDKRQAGEDIGYLKGGVIIAQRLFSALMVPPVLVLFLKLSSQILTIFHLSLQSLFFSWRFWQFFCAAPTWL